MARASILNPFNAETPIENPEMFFGRSRELTEIVDKRIRHSHPISTILIGGRKLGKTSLLYQIRDQLLGEASDGSDIIIPTFLTFQGRSSLDITTVFEEIASEIARSLRENRGLQVDFEDASGDPYKIFCQRLQKLLNQCSEHIGSVRFVILMDEADRLLGHTWTEDVISNLRNLINTSDLRFFVALVVTGFRDLHHFAMTKEEGIGSELGNAARWSNLSVLTKTECLDLITSPLKRDLHSSVVEAVYEQSGGHPYVTQYLMQRIWEPNPAEITLDSVNDACKQFSKDTRVFHSWQGKFDDLDRKVYYVLAHSKAPLSFQEVHELAQNDVGPGETEDSLDFLSYAGVVAKRDSKYLVAGRLYCDWFLARLAKDEKQDNPQTQISRQEQEGLNFKKVIFGTIIVLLIFSVTIAILVWAAQQVQSSITVTIIFVVALVFDLVSIVTALAISGVLPREWTTSFYERVLDKVPILDFSNYFKHLIKPDQSPDIEKKES